MRLITILCVLGSLVSLPVSLAARQDHHRSNDQQGAMVMGFDQARTTHHFLLFNDGGAIEVSVNDSADMKNRDAIRSHLPHIAMERVLLIQRALVVGLSLADLKRVLAVRDKGGSPCIGVRVLVGERLEQLNQRIEELLALRDELRSLVADWDGRLANTPKGERAHLLETLGSRAVIEQTRRKRRER
jgi:hypothetical protein